MHSCFCYPSIRMPRNGDHQAPRFDVAAGITFMPGAYVEPGAVIEENVYIGPNAVILSNGAGTEGSTIIRKGVEIARDATVLRGVTVGIRARIAPGSVVKRSVPPLATIEGNPAIITGYVESWSGWPAPAIRPEPLITSVQASRVRGVAVHRLLSVPICAALFQWGSLRRKSPLNPIVFSSSSMSPLRKREGSTLTCAANNSSWQ